LWQASGRENGRQEHAHSKHALILNRVHEQTLASPLRSLMPPGPAAPSYIAFRHSRESVLLLQNVACLIVELLAISKEIGESLQDFVCPKPCDRTSNILKPIFCNDRSHFVHHSTNAQGK
jgi:hypothetical protein